MSINATTYRGFDVDVVRDRDTRRLIISDPKTGAIIWDEVVGRERAEDIVDDHLKQSETTDGDAAG